MSSEQSQDRYVQSRRSPSTREAAGLPRLLLDAVRLSVAASRTDAALLVALQVAVAGMTAGQVFLSRSAFHALLSSETQDLVGRAGPPLVALVALGSVARLLTTVASSRQRLLAELVGLVSWRRILAVTTSVPLETFEDATFYDQLQRIQSDAANQPVVVVSGLMSILGGALSSAGVLVALSLVQPLLVPVLLLAGVPAFLLQRRGGRLEYSFVVAQTPGLRRRYGLSEVLTERLAAKEVRAFEVGQELARRHDALYEDYLAAFRVLNRKVTRLATLTAVTTAAFTLLALGLLLLLVRGGNIGLASAGSVVAAVAFLGSATSDVFAGAGRMVRAALFLRDMEEFTALGPTAAPGPHVAKQDAPVFEVLALEGVSYTYPGADKPSLSDVTLELHHGEVLALVGENGSGKTTLSKIVSGLLPPTEGRVTWDGTDLRDMDQQALRSACAVLFQDFVKYELTLRDNVLLARPGEQEEPEVEDAVRRAGAQQVVATAPAGWDTFMSPRFPGGVDLSGGQWQRVAMARTLLRDSSFVVLDEPTAALDARAEAALFDTLRGVLGGRSVVLVTHRFSSARLADRIAVLADGRIVELGTHEELMALGGRYHELFRLQARAFGLEQQPPAVDLTRSATAEGSS